MHNLLKSDLFKLITVRSTYVISALAILFVAILSFYTGGWGSRGYESNPFVFNDLVRNIATTVSVLTSILAVLQVVHEYRYNIIMHTLTASSSRTKVLFSKFLVVIGYSIAFTFFCTVLGIVMYVLGAAVGGQTIVSQEFPVIAMMSRSLFYVFGSTMLAFLVAVLTRNLAATLVLMLFGIGAAEGLLMLVLKESSKYLPTRLLDQVLSDSMYGLDGVSTNSLSPLVAALLFSIYLVATSVAAWYLFLKRDAN